MPIPTHIITEQGRAAWNGCYHVSMRESRDRWRALAIGLAVGWAGSVVFALWISNYAISSQ